MSNRDQLSQAKGERGRAVERLKSAVAERSRLHEKLEGTEDTLAEVPANASISSATSGRKIPERPSPERIEELEAEARYHRERLALYQGKVYGARPTTAARLRELQHASDRAAQRLRHALRDLGAPDNLRG